MCRACARSFWWLPVARVRGAGARRRPPTTNPSHLPLSVRVLQRGARLNVVGRVEVDDRAPLEQKPVRVGEAQAAVAGQPASDAACWIGSRSGVTPGPSDRTAGARDHAARTPGVGEARQPATASGVPATPSRPAPLRYPRSRWLPLPLLRPFGQCGGRRAPGRLRRAGRSRRDHERAQPAHRLRGVQPRKGVRAVLPVGPSAAARCPPVLGVRP